MLFGHSVVKHQLGQIVDPGGVAGLEAMPSQFGRAAGRYALEDALQTAGGRHVVLKLYGLRGNHLE